MVEKQIKLLPGWVGLMGSFVGLGVILLMIVIAASAQMGWLTPIIIICGIAWFILQFGFIVNPPNYARVVQLFGTYEGTLRETGFFYGNPFYSVTKVSLRTRTFETGQQTTEAVKDPTTGKVLVPATHTRQPSKVNDRDGTPIEVAAVVVWKVIQPQEAVFNVDNYEEFVSIQSEAALRNLISQYPYDGHGEERSLRGHSVEVGEELKRELHERFASAGVEVTEARISYLAYAPEIASAMLQRQQAGAMIAARKLVVEAAVSMVEHALDELSKRSVVDLDSDRKAAMVSNLLVVLCGHGSPQPVMNTGTLHN